MFFTDYVCFLHQFYTLVFSKPHVEAITWWDIDDSDSFIVTGGLLDERHEPKPAYYALRDLLAGWTTTGTGRTDEAGQVESRGFGGDYELAITHAGRTWHEAVHVREQREVETTITLENCASPRAPRLGRR